MKSIKRRSLVLTDETAHHPFRASLAPHVLHCVRPITMAGKRRWFTMNDLRDFLLAYCACFLAVSLYIA